MLFCFCTRLVTSSIVGSNTLLTSALKSCEPTKRSNDHWETHFVRSIMASSPSYHLESGMPSSFRGPSLCVRSSLLPPNWRLTISYLSMNWLPGPLRFFSMQSYAWPKRVLMRFCRPRSIDVAPHLPPIPTHISSKTGVGSICSIE
jgi:hypothetical protein